MKQTKTLTKLLALILALAAVFSLAACSGQTSSSSNSSQASTAAAENSQTETSAQNGKVLVVYFSATGNTKEIANAIAEASGGTLFEIEPAEPYTDDDLNYNDSDSRVCREYNDESLRGVELKTTAVENWSDYDTVFIGYPIWWGIAAWPVNGFVSANDFSGKRVIPFCSSASSGLGESGKNLETLCGTGNWEDGKRFSSNADSEEVKTWVNELGL